MGNLDDPIVFRYRGRDLTAADLASIRTAIATHYARGRTYIGLRLCEQWDWRQANGQYKAFAARDLLLRLERAGLVELPAAQRVKVNRARQSYAQIPLFIQTPLGEHWPIIPRPEFRRRTVGPRTTCGITCSRTTTIWGVPDSWVSI